MWSPQKPCLQKALEQLKASTRLSKTQTHKPALKCHKGALLVRSLPQNHATQKEIDLHCPSSGHTEFPRPTPQTACQAHRGLLSVALHDLDQELQPSNPGQVPSPAVTTFGVDEKSCLPSHRFPESQLKVNQATTANKHRLQICTAGQ